MAKKGAPALQTDVTTNEEWEHVLERPGLVLVDVYSEWSGPCTSLISTLKKIKMDSGGDLLSYAIAKNDNITSLERFRGRCEPAWMFIQKGLMVNMMLGTHCPKMVKLLLSEITRVKNKVAPKWSIPVTTRGPEEEVRWQKTETIRKALEEEKAAAEEAARIAKYNAWLEQMVFELCEETGLLLYPWVFISEDGYPMDKNLCPAYTELADLFRECFEIVEEVRVELDEETVGKMFMESDLEINDDILAGLCSGSSLCLRLKGKPPHPEWPVVYPNVHATDDEKAPIREINDVENYLINIILRQPPPLIEIAKPRMSFSEPYYQRHLYVHEPDPEIEDDISREFPAIWMPANAKNKVHFFQTIFHKYMDSQHYVEEPPPPAPLCAFKFLTTAKVLAIVSESYASQQKNVAHFGVFEFDQPPIAKRLVSHPDDFDIKVKEKTGLEVVVIVVRRVNEEAFLSFAGIDPMFICDDDKKAHEIAHLYFPPGSKDIFAVESDDDEGEYQTFGVDDYDSYEDIKEQDEELEELGYGYINYENNN